MDVETFDDIVRGQIQLSEDVLLSKATEYAEDSDRLHNFRVAAAIQGVSEVEALGGMMAKHSVSIYDMIRSGNGYSLEKWEEKIGDHINYLLLLKALVIDNGLADVDIEPNVLKDWFENHYPKNTIQDMYHDEKGSSIISELISDWDEERAEREERIARAVALAFGQIKPSDLLNDKEENSDPY